MKSSVLVFVLSALLLAGCSKKEEPVSEAAAPIEQAASTPSNLRPVQELMGGAASAASTPASAARKPVVKAAKFDPNLKPTNIVWDSPEKKKAWEARRAQLSAQQGQAPAQQPQQMVPVQKR